MMQILPFSLHVAREPLWTPRSLVFLARPGGSVKAVQVVIAVTFTARRLYSNKTTSETSEAAPLLGIYWGTRPKGRTVVVMVDGLTKNVAAAMTAHTEDHTLYDSGRSQC